jgi:hypothetical protein
MSARENPNLLGGDSGAPPPGTPEQPQVDSSSLAGEAEDGLNTAASNDGAGNTEAAVAADDSVEPRDDVQALRQLLDAGIAPNGAELPSEAAVKSDATVMLSPETARALAKVRAVDEQEYFRLLRQLLAAADKNSGVSQTRVEAAVNRAAKTIQQEEREAGEEKESAINALIRLGRENTELFHTADGVAHATVQENGHRQTLRLRSRSFTDRLLFDYFQETGRGTSLDAVTNAVHTLEAIARRQGPELPVYPRVGFHGGKVYVDRGTDDFDAYEIEPATQLPDGTFKPSWRLIKEPPVRFIRPEGVAMGELPVAVAGGDLNGMKPFLALRTDDDFVLSIGGVLGNYCDVGERAHIALSDRPGAGKTARTRFLCSLYDPLPAAPDKARTAPGDPGTPYDDAWSLMLTAKSQLALTLDNLSDISDLTADVLCRLASGALMRRRNFYSLHEETAIAAKRSVIMTMTKALVLRDDLSERCLFPDHAHIKEEDRRTVEELWGAYLEKWPGFLGCIFDAVSVGLANTNLAPQKKRPRLADLAQWVARCEPALGWAPGTFLNALLNNRAAGAETVVDANPVAAAIRDFMAKPPTQPGPLRPAPDPDKPWPGWAFEGWCGTATELLEELKKITSLEVRKDKRWPKAANKLRDCLSDAVNGLEQLGVVVETGRSNTARIITLRWRPGHNLFRAGPASSGGTTPLSSLPSPQQIPIDDNSNVAERIDDDPSFGSSPDHSNIHDGDGSKVGSSPKGTLEQPDITSEFHCDDGRDDSKEVRRSLLDPAGISVAGPEVSSRPTGGPADDDNLEPQKSGRRKGKV